MMNRLYILLILIILSIACGGGGGGGGGSVTSGGFTGTSGDPVGKVEVIVDASNTNSVDFIDLNTGNVISKALASNQTAEQELDNGDYELRTTLDNGGILRKKFTVAGEDLNLTLDTTSTTAVLFDELDSTSQDNLISTVENLGYVATTVLSSSEQNDKIKNAALTTLSIRQAVKDTNESGNGSELLDGAAYITDSRVLDNRDNALKEVIEDKGIVITPEAGGLFTAQTDNEVDTSSNTLDETIVLKGDYVPNYVDNTNNIPIANAGADQRPGAGDTVTLNAARSFDGDGDDLTYAWAQIDGQIVAPQSDNSNQNWTSSPNPSFTAPHTSDNVLIFRLLVHDGTAYSVEDTVTITVDVSSTNTPPQALLVESSSLTVAKGATVELKGDFYDDDDDEVTFQWNQAVGSGEQVILVNSNSATATFTAPDTEQTLIFSFRVFDGQAFSDTQTVTVTVSAGSNKPIILSNSPNTGVLGVEIEYQIIAVDQDDDPLFYSLTELEPGMKVDSDGLFTWTSYSSGIFSANIEITDGLHPVYQMIEIEIYDDGTVDPVMVSKAFSKATTLDFSGGTVELNNSSAMGVDVEIIAEDITISGNFSADSNFTLTNKE